MSNPLQQHFRQPKIYVRLPSGGIFNKIGTLQGDVTNMPVYGMTGMDEIIMKTPDALLSGESTARVVQSCCPGVKDAWEVTTLDMPLLIAALRIATYGSALPITHTCPNCGTEHEYDLDLGKTVEFYNTRKFDKVIQLDSLTVNLQPLTYRQSTDFSIKNFQLQQKLGQVEAIKDAEEQQKMVNALFEELAVIQNDIYIASVESVETSTGVVTDKNYIAEWLKNCDSSVFDAIKKKIDENREAWSTPTTPVKCDSCGHESGVIVELDQSNFFVKA
jgi:RNase P subunit RPR2